MRYKLTPWFSGDQKPTRIGVYERKNIFNKFTHWCYWTGSFWGCGYISKDLASDPLNRLKGINQHINWRGILK